MERYEKRQTAFCEESILAPAFSSNNIAITMASSDDYASFLFVLLASIQANATERNYYDIIVLSDGISLSNRTALLELITKNNFSLRFVDSAKWVNNKAFRTVQHITRTTYIRFVALDVLSRFEKVIYLDCDTVVNRDIAELYQQRIDGYMVAAVKDTVMRGWCCINGEKGEEYRKYIAENLGMPDNSQYFNAGVMVLNLKEFQCRKYTSKFLLDMALEGTWKWLDQDILNKVCSGHVLFLDARWNVMVHPYEFEAEMSESNMPEQEYARYLKTVSDPYIVHYAGHAMPVYEPTVDRCDLFWKYARKTSKYGQLQNDMRREIVRKYKGRSMVRKIADVLIPYGSKRRAFLRSIIKQRI